MEQTLRLFTVALENLKDGDEIETAHVLRTLADEIEKAGCPDMEELVDLFNEFISEYEEDN